MNDNKNYDGNAGSTYMPIPEGEMFPSGSRPKLCAESLKIMESYFRLLREPADKRTYLIVTTNNPDRIDPEIKKRLFEAPRNINS